MKNLAKLLSLGLLTTSVAHAAPVPRAMVFDLQRQDLTQLAQGLDDIFAQTPVVGRYDDPIEHSFGWGTARVEGIAYQFNLTNIRVTPESGHLRVDVDMANLQAKIEKLSFNDAGSIYCRNIPLSTHGAAVAVGTDVNPWIDSANKSFHVATTNTNIGLTARNFRIERPEVCHTVWGFNWLVRRLIPWTSSLLRSRVQDGIEQAIAQHAEKLSQDYGKALDVHVTLPVDAKPIPAFYANLNVWPDALEVTPDHLQFFIGANVEFDPDPRFGGPEEEALNLPDLLKAGNRVPSYFGIARGLLQQVIREANDQGLFQFALTQDNAPPGAAELMQAGVVALMIPDATTRFDPEADVALDMGGAAQLNVEVEPQGGPGGIPIIDFCLQGLRLGLSIKGQPYYDMNLDVKFAVALGLNPATRQLRLTFQTLGAKFLSGSFAKGLSPEPTEQTFNVEFLDFFIKQLNEQMAAEGRDLMTFVLPEFRLGSRAVTYVGAGTRDDFITLDAIVK